MKKRTSPIWSLPENEFIKLVQTSKRMKDVLGFFNLKNKGGNNKTVKERIQFLNLDTSHFMNSTKSSWESRKMTLDRFITEYLIIESTRSRKDIKKYLLNFNLLKWECHHCKNNGFWNNKKLSLQLEHINGISNDNRLENLCFLCPNCHSQTDTFAGKKKRKLNVKNKKNFHVKTKSLNRKTKIIWPSNQKLQKLVFENSLLKLGNKLGVSDNAIRRHCKKNNIQLPQNGYWQKIYNNLGRWRKNKKLPTVVLPHA
jgi:Zn finger protein HypA/HybF involved in hydrogenase expression